MPPLRSAGFAMLDVLVALLLLAVALTGACATLVHTMRVTHEALLATRAVDLAADLSEVLRDVSSAARAKGIFAAWRSRVTTVLPVGGLAPDVFASLDLIQPDSPDAQAGAGMPVFQLTLRWQESYADGQRELRLPIATSFAGVLP